MGYMLGMDEAVVRSFVRAAGFHLGRNSFRLVF